MAVYYKPQSPIQSGEDFIYPITTADQIMKSDNSRRLEQAGLIVADNSTSLGGVAASGYALKTDTAPDSNKLGGVAAIDYALKTDTAPDSNKLGGKAPEYYIQPRNLLDNSDFANPVNQRGQTSYEIAAGTYNIDRWVNWLETSDITSHVIVQDGYITVETGGKLQQKLASYKQNTIYTAAAKRTDGTVLIVSGMFSNVEIGEDIFIKTGSDGIANVGLRSGDYLWIALYEGSYTAETLPPYVPKGYAVELAECQRYYLPVQDFWSMGIILTGTGYICLNIPTNIKMRITPNVIISGAKAYHPTYSWFDLTYGSIEWYPPFYRIKFTWPDNIQSSLSDLVLINGVSGLSADL